MKAVTAQQMKRIIAIEDTMNRLSREQDPHQQTSSGAGVLVGLGGAALSSLGMACINTDLIDHFMDEFPDERKDLAFVDRHLRQRGYVRENGSINYTRFQDDAVITQSVWSRYASGKQPRTDHDTLLKIVLGLRLTRAEADDYMAMTGSGFTMTDMVDKVILCYIMADYLGDEDTVDIVGSVSFLLDFYSEQEVKAKRKPLRVLYKL